MSNRHCVMPAKAGIHAQHRTRTLRWIPAFAGMTLLSACSPEGFMADNMKNEPQKPIENTVSADGKLISPDCPNWTASSTHSYSNERPANMGCAYVTNLGLMLEDPRDLERGASGGRITPNADRSADAIQNYRTGLAPSSSNDAAGSAADLANAVSVVSGQ